MSDDQKSVDELAETDLSEDEINKAANESLNIASFITDLTRATLLGGGQTPPASVCLGAALYAVAMHEEAAKAGNVVDNDWEGTVRKSMEAAITMVRILAKERDEIEARQAAEKRAAEQNSNKDVS